jgi:hypothetical protein
VPQPDHRQEELVRGLEVEIVAPADGSSATRTFEPLAASGCERSE